MSAQSAPSSAPNTNKEKSPVTARLPRAQANNARQANSYPEKAVPSSSQVAGKLQPQFNRVKHRLRMSENEGWRLASTVR